MSHDVLVAGETLIDWIPERSGPLEDVDSFERRPGGAPANVAVALARLERPPLFWTRVGADPFGRYLERILENNGLPIRFVERDPGAKTTLAFVTHDETGERAFTFYRDGTADTRLEPGRIDDETLADCEWVHAGGVTLSSGPSRAATLDLLERAAAAGCTVSFDPNLRPALWPNLETFASVVGDALAHVDVCLATAAELKALGFDGGSSTEHARAAIEGGPVHTVFVTRVTRVRSPSRTTARHGPRTQFLIRGSMSRLSIRRGPVTRSSPERSPPCGTGERSRTRWRSRTRSPRQQPLAGERWRRYRRAKRCARCLRTGRIDGSTFGAPTR